MCAERSARRAWRSTASGQVSAFSLNADSNAAALLRTVSPGGYTVVTDDGYTVVASGRYTVVTGDGYTVVMGGVSRATGVTLAEVYLVP